MAEPTLHLLCTLDNTRDWDEFMSPVGLFQTREAMQMYLDDNYDPETYVVDEDWIIQGPSGNFLLDVTPFMVFELPIYTT